MLFYRYKIIRFEGTDRTSSKRPERVFLVGLPPKRQARGVRSGIPPAPRAADLSSEAYEKNRSGRLLEVSISAFKSDDLVSVRIA